MNVPFYISQLLIVITAVIIYSIFYALNYAFKKLEYSSAKKSYSLLFVFLLLGAWLTLTAVLASRGFFLDFQSQPPKLLFAIVPPALAIGYISASERVNRLLQVLPKSWLIYIQSFRLLMEIFLFLMLINGAVPVQMTFEGRNFDIIIGLTAPFIAYFSYTRKIWPKIVPLLWNLAGFLLLANIFLVGILSAPGPLRKFFNEPPNSMIAYFPFVWILAFIIPFAFLMHILSVKQIMRYDEDIS